MSFLVHDIIALPLLINIHLPFTYSRGRAGEAGEDGKNTVLLQKKGAENFHIKMRKRLKESWFSLRLYRESSHHYTADCMYFHSQNAYWQNGIIIIKTPHRCPTRTIIRSPGYSLYTKIIFIFQLSGAMSSFMLMIPANAKSTLHDFSPNFPDKSPDQRQISARYERDRYVWIFAIWKMHRCIADAWEILAG